MFNPKLRFAREADQWVGPSDHLTSSFPTAIIPVFGYPFPAFRADCNAHMVAGSCATGLSSWRTASFTRTPSPVLFVLRFNVRGRPLPAFAGMTPSHSVPFGGSPADWMRGWRSKRWKRSSASPNGAMTSSGQRSTRNRSNPRHEQMLDAGSPTTEELRLDPTHAQRQKPRYVGASAQVSVLRASMPLSQHRSRRLPSRSPWPLPSRYRPIRGPSSRGPSSRS